MFTLFGHTYEGYGDHIDDEFACFEDDLNAELRKQYLIMMPCRKNWGRSTDTAIVLRKEPVIIGEMLERTYKQGHECQMLSEIVDRIVSMAR